MPFIVVIVSGGPVPVVFMARKDRTTSAGCSDDTRAMSRLWPGWVDRDLPRQSPHGRPPARLFVCPQARCDLLIF